MNDASGKRFFRAGKGGVVFVLLLALAVAGAVYWLKLRSPVGGSGTANSNPTPASTRQLPVPGAAQTPSGGSTGTPAPHTPNSIFDDGLNSPNNESTAPPPPSSPALPAIDSQRLQSLQTAVQNASAALEAARAKARVSPAFVERQAEVDELDARRKEARKSGASQEWLDLSSQWNKARLSLKTDQDKAAENDPAVLRAKAALDQAQKAVQLYVGGR